MFCTAFQNLNNIYIIAIRNNYYYDMRTNVMYRGTHVRIEKVINILNKNFTRHVGQNKRNKKPKINFLIGLDQFYIPNIYLSIPYYYYYPFISYINNNVVLSSIYRVK